MKSYLPSIPRLAFGVAACAMSALTISLTVIAPAEAGAAQEQVRVFTAAPASTGATACLM